MPISVILAILASVVCPLQGTLSAQIQVSTSARKSAPVPKSALDSAGVFPETTLAYAQIQPPSKIVNWLLNHPLRERIEAIPQVKSGLKSKEYAAFLAGIGFAQFYTGMEWQESLETLAGGGIAIGFDPAKEAVGAVFMSSRPDQLPKLYKGLLKLANQNEQSKVNEGEYRNQKAYAVGKQLYLIPVKDRVFVSNKKAMVKQMLDYWLDKPAKSLASNSGFTKSTQNISNQTAWAYANLKTIRDSGMAENLFVEKTENIGAELLIGGVLEATRTAKDLSAAITLNDEGVGLSLYTSLDESQVSPERSYFYGTSQEREEFERLKLDDSLGEIFAFRDLGKLWLSKEDLFDENHLSELSQADSTLSTLFSGLDFGEEVLGSTEPGFQIVARNQNYEQLETPQPDIKVPEFALVFRLKEDDRVQRRFRVAYQSFIGFLNIQLAMQGNPQLELESEKVDGARIVSATYLPDENKEYEGMINYNFSPTIAFADQWFIISSTKQLAGDLVVAGQRKSVTKDPQTNTSITIYGQQAKAILAQNAEQLIAQNMLEEGNDRKEAKAQIDLLLEVVGLIKQTSLNLKNESGRLSLNLGIQVESSSK